jgi:hypothetical protein
VRARLLSIRATLVLAAVLQASCTSSRGSSDAGDRRVADAGAVTDGGGVAAEDRGVGPDGAVPDSPIIGEWERLTEPYKGTRAAIRSDGHTTRMVVTAPPAVTEERLALQARSAPGALAKAQLECQRSLWKAGDELIAEIRPDGEHAFAATILVRDWGFTGTCRHADSRARAGLSVSSAGELSIAVSRGKTVTQQWRRTDR